MNLTGLDRPDRVRGGFVTSAFFDVAGVQVARGRPLRPADDEPNAAPVAVINDTFWQRRLGGAPDVLGRVVQLNNIGFEIVGVMPPGFVVPVRRRRGLAAGAPRAGHVARARRAASPRSAVFVPDVTLAQGQADLDGVAASLAAAWPAANTDRGVRVTEPARLADLRTSTTSCSMIFALVIVLLVAAAANVASLQVGATVGATRRSVGASRARRRTTGACSASS